MVERAKAMVFAGGAMVFPGGRIDPADRLLAETMPKDLEVDEAAARIAAIRETVEEAGLPIGLDSLPDAATLVQVLDVRDLAAWLDLPVYDKVARRIALLERTGARMTTAQPPRPVGARVCEVAPGRIELGEHRAAGPGQGEGERGGGHAGGSLGRGHRDQHGGSPTPLRPRRQRPARRLRGLPDGA